MMRWPRRRPKLIRLSRIHEDVTVILPAPTRSLNMSCRAHAKEKR